MWDCTAVFLVYFNSHVWSIALDTDNTDYILLRVYVFLPLWTRGLLTARGVFSLYSQHPGSCLSDGKFATNISCMVSECWLDLNEWGISPLEMRVLFSVGESIPVTKTPLPKMDSSAPWKTQSEADYKRHVLFCGTEVIQVKATCSGNVRAVVLQTG